MVEVNQGRKVAGLELATKNMVMHRSHAELGLHPATLPTGTIYFNLRAQGKGSMSSVPKEKCEACSMDPSSWTRLDPISGPMFSEAYCCYVIMMVGLNIIQMPYWLPVGATGMRVIALRLASLVSGGALLLFSVRLGQTKSSLCPPGPV